MEALRDYFTLMLFVSLSAGVLGTILHDSLRDISLMAIGIISLCALVSPLREVVSALADPPSFSAFSEIPEGGLSDTLRDSFLLGVKGYISSEWHIPEDDVSLSMDGFCNVDVRAAELAVSLSGAGALADVRGMRERLEELFVLPGGKCVVVIELDK